MLACSRPMRRRTPILLFLWLAQLSAGTPEEALRELGRRLASRLGAQERLSIQTRALPPILPGERDEVDRALRLALGGHLSAAAPATVRVTVSAVIAQHVLVAEFRRGEEVSIMMAEYEAPVATRRPALARAVLERSLMWEQDEQILDATMARPEAGELLVLDTERLTWRDRSGQVTRQLRVRRDGPAAWPRDLRGRLSVSGEGVRVWLPGWECRAGNNNVDGHCAAGATAWPLAPQFQAALAGSNEFSSGGKDRFFGAARVTASAVVLAGVDGRLRWSEAGAVRELDASVGSEVVSLTNPCDGSSVLVASSKDGQALGVFDVSTRGVRAAGEGMALPGTLSALWPADGEGAATAVVRTAAGRYAAYRLLASCSR